MLQALWYMLVLLVQILQTDPKIQPDKLQFEVYAGSVPALTLSMRGTMVQGSFVDSDAKKPFGEFESTKRLPQTFVIFPSQGLNDELSAGLASGDKGSDKSGSSGQTAAAGTSGSGASANGGQVTGASTKGKSGSGQAPDLSPFTLDFTKALKLLKSFSTMSRQRIPFTEANKLLGSDSSAKSASGAATMGNSTGATSATNGSAGTSAANAANTATTGAATSGPSPSPSSDAAKEIEIRVFPNRIVLSADFMQLVIIVTYK